MENSWYINESWIFFFAFVLLGFSNRLLNIESLKFLFFRILCFCHKAYYGIRSFILRWPILCDFRITSKITIIGAKENREYFVILPQIILRLNQIHWIYAGHIISWNRVWMKQWTDNVSHALNICIKCMR